MNLLPTDIGDDGFTVPCKHTQFDAVVELCKLACAAHGVDIIEPMCGGNDEGDYVRITFRESQEEEPVEAILDDLRTGTFTATAPTEPATRTFMVTVTWRGLHVVPLRTFVVESEARQYAKTLTGGIPVLYETFTNKPPKKLEI